MVHFSCKWAREEREVLKLSSLSNDKIPKSGFSYFTKWSDFIAKDANSRCGFQISGSDITIQHLTVYFAHRGGKGNLGNKCSADHRAKMNQAMNHRARMSKAKMGKKRSAETRAKISKAMMGKKRSAKTRAKMSNAMMSEKRSADKMYCTAANCQELGKDKLRGV